MQEPLFKEVFEVYLRNDSTIISFVAGSQGSYYRSHVFLVPLCTQM